MTKEELQLYCPNQLFYIPSPKGTADITIGYFRNKQDIDNFPIEDLKRVVNELFRVSGFKFFIVCNWYLPDDDPNKFIVLFYNKLEEYAVSINQNIDYCMEGMSTLDDRAAEVLEAYGNIGYYIKTGIIDKAIHMQPYLLGNE